MADVGQIQAAVSTVLGSTMRMFVSAPATRQERQTLEALAYVAGIPSTATGEVSDADLIALFNVAQKKADAAPSIAARIARKYNFEADTDARPTAPTPDKPRPTAPAADLRPQFDELARKLEKSIEQQLEFIARDVDGYKLQLRASVAGMVAEAIEELAPTRVEYVRPDGTVTPIGVQHYQMPRLLRTLAAGLNVYLHGPAGSGKTTAAHKCADAFGLKFYTTAKVESEYLLLGFKDARGETVRTSFREAYEHGGVFLFDELDASSPGAIVALNMALANGYCSFPDGTIQRHPDFKCVAGGNTVLSGASREYAGRNQLDGASIDRFYFLEWQYDEKLEMTLAPNKDWCAHVQAIRAAVKARGIPHLVTPRATLDGCRALAMGDTWDEAEMSCVFKGLDADTVDAIRHAVKGYA